MFGLELIFQIWSFRFESRKLFEESDSVSSQILSASIPASTPAHINTKMGFGYGMNENQNHLVRVDLSRSALDLFLRN